MLRSLFGYLCSSAAVALLSAAPVFAAPVTTVARAAGVPTQTSLTQSVHWVWHHHHRIWVSDHYRHRHHDR